MLWCLYIVAMFQTAETGKDLRRGFCAWLHFPSSPARRQYEVSCPREPHSAERCGDCVNGWGLCFSVSYHKCRFLGPPARSRVRRSLCACCCMMFVWLFARACWGNEAKWKWGRVWKAPWWRCCLSETVLLGSAVIHLNLDKWSCASGILHPDCSRFLKAMSFYCMQRLSLTLFVVISGHIGRVSSSQVVECIGIAGVFLFSLPLSYCECR